MKKYLIYIFLLFFIITGKVQANDAPVAGRTWIYANSTLLLSRSVGWLVMPGFRHEFSRNLAGKSLDTNDLYFYEFFTGPIFFTGIGKLKVILPFFYYYMGFPLKAQDKYVYNHNLEFSPTFVYKTGDVIIYNRLIFHNTIFSTFYREVLDNKDWQKGYSLLLRWKLMIQYIVNPKLILEIAEEPFYGLIEDKDMPPVTGPGFSEKGLDMNRIYAGFTYKITKKFTVEVNYVYETSYKEDTVSGKKEHSQTAHYIFITFKNTFKLF